MSDLSDFEREIEQATGKIRKHLATGTLRVAQVALSRIKDRTPVDTGALRDGWRLEGSGTELEIVNDEEYASFVEEGTPSTQPAGMVALTLSEMEDEEFDDDVEVE